MRARHIEAFHAIYSSGSISVAAKVLGVSQPSLSKVLKHAEDQLGYVLFRRVRGRLVATEEAHILFREVSEVEQRLASLRKTARNLRTGGGRHLRVAVLPALGLGVAPAAIANFRKQHPDTSFEVMTHHHDDVLRVLYERRCELAVAYAPTPHPQLKVTTIGSAEVVILFRSDEFENLPPRLNLKWLRGRNVVGLSTSGPVGDLYSAAAAERDVVIKEMVSVQTFYMAAALVMHGAGVAVVDELTAKASCSTTALDFRPLEPALRFNISVLHLEDRPLSLLARRFIQTMERILEETTRS